MSPAPVLGFVSKTRNLINEPTATVLVFASIPFKRYLERCNNDMITNLRINTTLFNVASGMTTIDDFNQSPFHEFEIRAFFHPANDDD